MRTSKVALIAFFLMLTGCEQTQTEKDGLAALDRFAKHVARGLVDD